MLTLVGGNDKGKGKGGFGKQGKSYGKGSYAKGGFGKDKGAGKGKGGFGGKGGKSYGKGKGDMYPFQGNCHNCDEWGHRAAQCPKPKKERGYRSVSENPGYQGQGNAYCAFMITSPQDTNVDYQNEWTHVGKGMVKPSDMNHTQSITFLSNNKFMALNDESLQSETQDESHAKSTISDLIDIGFPIPQVDTTHPVRQKMPKMPKQSQKLKVRFAKSKLCIDECCQEQDHTTPVAEPQAEPQAVVDSKSQIDNAWMATRMMANMRKYDREEVTDPITGETHCCLNQTCELCKSDNEPGRRMNKEELAEFDAEQDKWKRDHLNLITAVDDQALMAVDGDDMVWVQVPCAVESGACANVSPAGIFSLEKS